MLCSSAVLLTSLFAVVRACHPAENGRWYLSGARLCLKHNVALEPDKAMINDDDNDGDDGDNHGDDGEAGDEVIYAAYGIVFADIDYWLRCGW